MVTEPKLRKQTYREDSDFVVNFVAGYSHNCAVAIKVLVSSSFDLQQSSSVVCVFSAAKKSVLLAKLYPIALKDTV